ncbi:hypothetical protein [Paenibacillus lautus]
MSYRRATAFFIVMWRRQSMAGAGLTAAGWIVTLGLYAAGSQPSVSLC